MPASSSSNIWIAAGDGDLGRVQTLVDSDGLSPNAPDENTYTPMHAAASYGHISVLEFLVSRGGNVNVTDSDGDTPLYTVEDVDTARWLVEHGAQIDMRNAEGASPIEHLSEDFPTVAAFLRTRLPGTPSGLAPSTTSPSAPAPGSISQHAQERASEALADGLMAAVGDIMRAAEAEGREPDEDELRRVVGATVLEGMRAGFVASEQQAAEGAGDSDRADGGEAKRARTE